MFVRVAILLWGLILLASYVVLAGYSTRPGTPDDPEPSWPTESRIPRDDDRPLIVMFLDPSCPCSRASVANLERCMASFPANAVVSLVLVGHEVSETGSRSSMIDETIRRYASIRVFEDLDGREVRRFGVKTSGQVLAYDREGRLAFDGGITPSRGHEGDANGAVEVIRVARGHRGSVSRAPVYGCPIDPAFLQLRDEETP